MNETTGLTKVYGDKRAVDRSRVRTEPGEVMGFPGPNGSGKTATVGLSLRRHRGQRQHPRA